MSGKIIGVYRYPSQKFFIWFVLVVCCLPALIYLMGVDFSLGLQASFFNKIISDIFYQKMGLAFILTGALLSSIVLFQHVTRKSKAEKDPAESPDFLKQITDSVPNIISVYDISNYQLVYANQETSKFLGYTVEQLKNEGAKIFQLIVHPKDLAVVQESFEKYKTMKDDEVLENEYKIKDSKGSWRTMYSRGRVFKRDKNGKVAQILTIAQDITEKKFAEYELIENKRKFEAIFNQTFQLVYILSLEGRLLEINQTALNCTTSSPIEIMGIDFWECPWWPENKMYRDHIKNAITRAAYGETLRLELQLFSDQKNSTIDLSIKPIKNSEDEIILLVAEGRDISQLKDVEEQIRKSEAILSEAQRMAKLGSWEYNIEADEFLCSNETYRIFENKEYKRIINLKNLIDNISMPDRHEAIRALNRVITLSEPIDLEFRIKPAGEKIKWVRFTGQGSSFKNGKAVKISGIAQDITQQKETIEKISTSENLYRTLAHNMPDSSVLLLDQHLNVQLADGTIWNEKISQGESIIGKHISKVLSPETYDKFFPMYLETFEGKEYEFETQNRDKFYKVNLLGVKNQEENVIACLSVTHDITELKTYQRELEYRIEELNRSNKELEQFAYIASHDLQEPLRKIRAFGDRLSGKYKNVLGDDGVLYIERMENATMRMQTLIDDLLTFSRVTRNKESYIKTNLNEVISQIINDLEINIEQSSSKIRIDKLPVVYAMPSQMRQLFQNLLSNALKFTKPGTAPKVDISCDSFYGREIKNEVKLIPNAKYFRITIADNGIGFNEKFTDKIFTIFQRLHPRSEYEGTGIGLAVCKKIVENHHGIISVKSEPEKGSKFIVTLPQNQNIYAQERS